jgi:hypothetical protein
MRGAAGRRFGCTKERLGPRPRGQLAGASGCGIVLLAGARPARQSKKFVQAVAEAADLVDMRVGRGGFAEQHVDADGTLRVTYHQLGDVISLPRISAARLADAGMGEILDA